MKTYRRGTRKTYLRISIAAALLVLCAFPSLAGDSTVPTDFATIQAAIDDPGTMAGDTINVLAGTYAEGGIHVTKSVTIAGAGIGSTFIEPPGAVGFFPDADNVTLEDMTIRNGSQAVRFEKTGGTITGPTLTRVELKDNSSRGIELHNATTVTGLTVEDCNFESTNIGFRVSSSGHLDGGMFTGSTFTGNTIGIYEANDGGTSTLNDVDITGCTFTDHTSDQGTAIFLEEAEDVAILDNTFVDNRRDIQLFKWYQPAVPMSNISISGNTMTGTTDTVFALFNAHHVDGQTEFDGISFTNNIVSVDSSGANNGSAVYAGAHSTYLNATPSNGGIGWNTVEINCNLFTGLKAGTGVRYYNPKVPVGQELGGASLDVENNWWGTDSAPAIDALMQVPSITDYVPFLPTLPPRPECPGLPALPTVDFTAAAQSNSESVTTVTVTAQLSSLWGLEVQVPLLFSGSAADPADYSPDVTTLTIPAGTLSADLTLTVVDDAIDEPSELVDVQMGTPVNALPGTVTLHSAIIQDNDPPPTVDFTASFQSNAESVTPVTVTAQLSAVSAFTVQVPLTFGGSAADPADYSPDVTTLTIPAGMLSADLTLTVVDDALDELTEVIDVMMGVPVNAAPGTTTVHTALIQDNDDPPVVDFTAAAQSNDEGVTPVTATAQLSGPSGLDVEVPLTFGGTATDPDDYSPNTITLPTITIPAGMTTGTQTLTVVDDAIDENDETVVITMGTPTNATLGTTTVHTATIEDNDATPTVDFTAAAQSNDESVASVTVTAQLSAVSGLEVQVPLVFGGTATDPDDYGPDLTTLTIAAGTTSADLILTVVEDAIDENDETVIVTMGTPVNATPGSTTVQTVTIEDNDATPTVDFTAAAQSNDESVASVTVTAQLSAVSGLEVQVPVTFGGTAADPADYGPSTSTITIPAGMASADLTLTVVDDAIDELDETVIVTMGTPVNATPGTTTVHTATIEDNDATPTVDFTAASQSNDESVASVTVTAELSAVSGLQVEVPVTFSGTASDPADYSPDAVPITVHTITIAAGMASGDLTLTVVDDAIDELDETVIVTMGTPTNADLGTTTVHTATILDNDATPEVNFTSATQSNDESVASVTVTAELSAVSGLEAQVPLNLGGTASDPDDYTPDTMTLTIPAGTTTADLTLTVVDDAIDEADETVVVTFGALVNAVPGTSTTVHTATIEDNEPKPTVTFTAAGQSNDESVSPLTVTAELSAVSGLEVQVPLNFGGNAADPADYSPDTSTLTIPAGATSADLTLTVVDDAIDETSELVDVAMGTPVNAVPGAITLHTAVIGDNDPAPSVEFSTALQSNDESVTPVTVTAVLSAVSGKQVQVPVSFDGTASDPDDYSPSDTTILIQAGQGSGDITLAVVDDLLDEPTELVDVTMGVPVNASLGTTTVQTVLIEDNDVANAPPAIAILQPDGLDDTADGDFLIVWSDADPDDNAAIDLYYDTDASGEDGTFLMSTSENPDGAGDDRHLWDTGLLADGDYFVYAVIDDGVNPPVVDYSVGPVTIDHSAVACAPPASGDWMVTASCTLTASDTAPGDVIVAPGVVLTIDNHVTLEIDLVNDKLLVQPGGGVLVRALGTIRQP